MFSHSRTGILVTAAAASLLLGGCSPGDVQLEGKIFEYMGVSGQPQRARDPKLADRAPLVLPPSLERLPEPGSQAREQSDDEVAALADPDRQKTKSKAALERQQAEFCEKHFEQAKARGDLDAEDAKGPLGPCRGSILTALPKWLKGEQDGQQDQ